MKHAIMHAADTSHATGFPAELALSKLFTVKAAAPLRSLTHNRELAVVFRHMSDCYRYLGAEERFRANAYRVAAQTLENMNDPIDTIAEDIQQLDALKGVGESIAEKIQEYMHTGKIQAFEKLKKKVPYPLLELMDIEGIGPSTIRQLHDQLRVDSREALEQAVRTGRLERLKGIAANKKENIYRYFKAAPIKKRMPLVYALPIGNGLLNSIKKIKDVHQALLAGSLRRKKETIGDIDIVLSADRKQWKRIMNTITRMPEVKKVLAAGETKVSLLLEKEDIQVDIRLVSDDSFGAALFYFTGSKEFNIQMRTLAHQQGWKMNEYGVFEEKSGKKLAGKTEAEIFTLFHLPYLEPEARTGKTAAPSHLT